MPCKITNSLDYNELKKITEALYQGKKIELLPIQQFTRPRAQKPTLKIGQYRGLIIYRIDHSYHMGLNLGLTITRAQKDIILRQCLTQLTARYRISNTRFSIILKPRNDIPSGYGYALSFYKKNTKLRIHTGNKVAVFDLLRISTLGYRSFLRSASHYIHMLATDISGITFIIQTIIESVLSGIEIDPSISLTTTNRVLPHTNQTRKTHDSEKPPRTSANTHTSPTDREQSKNNNHPATSSPKKHSLKDPSWKKREAKYDDKGHILGLMERIKNTAITVPPNMTFDNIGGCQSAKEELHLLSDSLKKTEIFRKWGVQPVKGIVLHGPPGTGKTMLIQALAAETDSTLFCANVADISSKWIGDQELLINMLFDYAEINSPSIILFDEIDSICPDRGNVREWYRRIVSIILQRMDGFQKNNNVVVVGTTNYLEGMDRALLRPGRFDKIIEVPLPSQQTRETIFQIHCRNKRIKNIDYHLLAEKTPGFSGADIQAVIQFSLEKKLREELYHGKQPRYVLTTDLLNTIDTYHHARKLPQEQNPTQIYL